MIIYWDSRDLFVITIDVVLKFLDNFELVKIGKKCHFLKIGFLLINNLNIN